MRVPQSFLEGFLIFLFSDTARNVLCSQMAGERNNLAGG